MSYFMTGCTHFGHANIIKLANRPFMTVEEMDHQLILNWNTTVKPNDTVFHLGDFAWKNYEFYLEQLNGHIVRINGNHDPKNVWQGMDYLEIQTLQGEGVVLCHYPIEEWNGWYKGIYHFHCHTHKPQFVSARNRGNVTVEACDYRPILLEEAINRLRSERERS